MGYLDAKKFSILRKSTKNRFSKKSAKITFFSKFSHFFLKSIKNNVSWLNLTFLDLVFRKIFKKVFFRKKVLKTSELQNSYRKKKNILLKIFEISVEKNFLARILHISKMTILSDFCMLSKMGKMRSNKKINVIFVFSLQELAILAH